MKTFTKRQIISSISKLLPKNKNYKFVEKEFRQKKCKFSNLEVKNKKNKFEKIQKKQI